MTEINEIILIWGKYYGKPAGWVLHSGDRDRYATSRCENHINPTEDLLPIGSAMDVHYVSGKPQKVYSGSLTSMKLFWFILGLTGLEIVVFGLLLTAILA